MKDLPDNLTKEQLTEILENPEGFDQDLIKNLLDLGTEDLDYFLVLWNEKLSRFEMALSAVWALRAQEYIYQDKRSQIELSTKDVLQKLKIMNQLVNSSIDEIEKYGEILE